MSRDVLIVGLPRSGTSWVGSVLGSSPSVEYLREPITQSWLETGNRSPLIDPDIDSGYRDHSLRFLVGHPPRRLIKEVNPLLVPFVVSDLDLEVVLLLRHPCAVALSYHERGWVRLDLESRFGLDSTGDFWRDHGAYQALLLNAAAAVLTADRRVSYEVLTHDPEAGFAALAEQLGLEWSESSAAHLTSTLGRDDRGDPYSLQRDAAAARERWRSVLTGDQQKAVLAGFRRHAEGALPVPGRRRRWSRRR